MLGLELSLGLGDGLDDGLQDKANRADGVVVAGDGVLDQVRVAIGVHQGDDGNLEAAAFGDGVVLAFDVHDEESGGIAFHAADAVEVFEKAGGFAPIHGLLLFDVVIDAAVGFPFFDLLEAGDGALDGFVIGEGAAEPAFGDVKLIAGFGGFLDGFLGLFFGADEEDLTAGADFGAEEFASGLELGESLAEVDDVNAVAGVEDEFFHLRVPSAGLMAEMDARVEQFLDPNTDHNFPFVRDGPRFLGRAAIPRKTGLN